MLNSWFASQPFPFFLNYAGRKINGEFPGSSEHTVTVSPDGFWADHTYCGKLDNSLELIYRVRMYNDYPVAECSAELHCDGTVPSQIVDQFRLNFDIAGSNPVLIHGNGDTCHPDGYTWFEDPVNQPLSLFPKDGTSCNGAFPYMRLITERISINIAIGWPTRWIADFTPDNEKVTLSVGQKRCHTVVYPGEILRTPTLTVMTFTGTETDGANLWRRWYRDHILPHEKDGSPLKPKLCLHLFEEGGYSEFTGATNDGQIRALDEYISKGLKPDVWWIDAGWYPCDHNWTTTGSWIVDRDRFPQGLAPIGQKCADNDVRFLLWFEPERVREHTWISDNHPEWLLRHHMEDGSLDENSLLNLGNPECLKAITDHVCKIIQDSGVTFYRQDFNFNPAPHWEENEPENRIGMLENLHAQGYWKYWDALLQRNPGLLIDSCASGGRRNDLGTMRRAVPLHYTDVGYGHFPIKLKQHRQMFEWIPYFRAHNMNWLEPDGSYSGKNHEPDVFAFYAAMAPAMTDMTRFDADEKAFSLSRRMNLIWRKAAELMIKADFYPLTEREVSNEGFFANQFHDSANGRGFYEVLSNPLNTETTFIPKLHALESEACYRIEDTETGGFFFATGSQLMDGIPMEMEAHTATICFYQKI